MIVAVKKARCIADWKADWPALDGCSLAEIGECLAAQAPR
jgi:hypothetical protein